MSTVSLVWGIVSLVGMIVGFLPCLGSLNWLNIPFSAAGVIVSIIALTKAAPGQKGGPIAGVVLCSAAVLLGLIRLVAGGGVV
jgi:hypothetical protein